MFDDLNCEFTDAPKEGDLKVVDAGLSRFNHAAADLTAVRPLACFARDAGGTIVGGVRARQWGAALEVQVLWVDESHRRRGIARRLMERLEQAAAERGVTVIYLDTFSFQAPEFYRRCGYHSVVRIDGFPDGIARHLMVKHEGRRDAG